MTEIKKESPNTIWIQTWSNKDGKVDAGDFYDGDVEVEFRVVVIWMNENSQNVAFDRRYVVLSTFEVEVAKSNFPTEKKS